LLDENTSGHKGAAYVLPAHKRLRNVEMQQFGSLFKWADEAVCPNDFSIFVCLFINA